MTEQKKLEIDTNADTNNNDDAVETEEIEYRELDFEPLDPSPRKMNCIRVREFGEIDRIIENAFNGRDEYPDEIAFFIRQQFALWTKKTDELVWYAERSNEIRR